MDIYFTFDKATRTLSSNRKAYAGQVFDANSTRLHFEVLNQGVEWDFFSENYVPYVVFDVCDERGFPFVYGLNTSPVFDGYNFEVPFDITSRARSARLTFQLWYVSAKYQDTFDGTPNGMLRTEYLLSATAGIAIKPSCVKPPRGGCGDMPFSPTTNPSVIGNLEFYKEHAVILPMEATQQLNGSGIDFTAHTLSGQYQTIHLPVATVDLEGKVSIEDLPTGNQPGQLPKLVESIGQGQTLVYGPTATELGYGYGFKGASLPATIEYVPSKVIDEETGRRSVPYMVLKDFNGAEMSRTPVPVDNVVENVEYDFVNKDIVIWFGNGQKLTIPLDDLVDQYEEGYGIHIDKSSEGQGQQTMYTISLDTDYVNETRKSVEKVQSNLDAHTGRTDNPHNVTKAQVGLGSVDNTSDSMKPVSAAQQAALDEVDSRLDAKIDANTVRIAALETKDSQFDTDYATTIQELRNADASLAGRFQNYYDRDEINGLVETKQDRLIGGTNIEIDDQNRINYVGPDVHIDTALSSESTNPVQNRVINSELAKKQDRLVEGDNISIIGNRISATLPKITVDETLSFTSENPVQNKVIARALDRKANIGEGVSVWKGQANGGSYLYNAGDVVVYDYNLYVSKVDNNDHHPDDETCWNVCRSGALSSVTAVTMPTYIGVFGNDAATDYTITHNLGTRNLVWSIITNDSEYEFKQARVSAPTLNTLRVRLSSPPGTNGLVINVMKVRTAQPMTVTEYPAVIAVNQPSAEWSFQNDTGLPLYAKAYDTEGNDINGDIIQNSVSAYSPLTVGFASGAHAGSLLLAKTSSENVHEMNGTSLTIDAKGKDYLVQCFKDGEGQSRLDIIQKDGKVKIGAAIKWKGVVCLYEATGSKSFTESDLKEETVDGETVYTLTYQHNKGRVVGAQVYGDEGLAIVDTHCPTPNTVKVYFGVKMSGKLLII